MCVKNIFTFRNLTFFPCGILNCKYVSRLLGISTYKKIRQVGYAIITSTTPHIPINKNSDWNFQIVYHVYTCD